MTELHAEDTAAHALAALVHLGQRARQAQDKAELRFILVNETHALTPYRQAALWLRGQGVVTLSGVVSVESNAPYVQWLEGIFRHLDATGAEQGPRNVHAADLPDAEVAEWGHWLPPEAAWIPLPPAENRFPGGGLLLTRDEPWTAAELALAGEWADIWRHAYGYHDANTLQMLRQSAAALLTSLEKDQRRATLAAAIRAVRTRPKAWATIAAIAALCFPVKLTVLAPAEIIPLNPSVIRAPLDGVIDHISVMPNQRVHANDTLFAFDRTAIASKLQIAEKALETARTEYRLRAQQALYDEASKAQLAVLQGQVAEKTVDVEYLTALAGRSTVTAPRDGVVLFDDPTEWAGRPVSTGQRVMMVADDREVEIEAWLAPANAVAFPPDAPVTVYLNADPLHPIEGTLRYVAHEATHRPEGHYAYRVRAKLTGPDERARTGLKGTAKLEAGRVPLFYWVLRRPLADARAWLGW